MGVEVAALRRSRLWLVSDRSRADWSVYDAYDEAVSRLWRTIRPTGDGSSGARGEREGDRVCEPDRSHQDAIAITKFTGRTVWNFAAVRTP